MALRSATDRLSGYMMALKEHDIGLDEARVVHPKLTTLRLPLEQMGRVAPKLLPVST